MVSVDEVLANQLCDLQKKEKQSYTALSALIACITGENPVDQQVMSFSQFKKVVLSSVAAIKKNIHFKPHSHEPKFNVKHYERSILCAYDASYRDVVIHAACKDLNPEAQSELLESLSKSCRLLTRKVRQINAELRELV